MRHREPKRCAGGVALALLLLVAGCGETHVIPEGVLEVHNDWGSDATVLGLEIQEIVGPNFLAFDVHADPGDTVVVDVYPSLYDISVLWSDGGYETWWDVEIQECCTTTLDVHR